MEEQYSRLLPLVGEDKLKLLHNKKILIFGLGGVGGYVVESLARSGIKNFTLVDNDSFNQSNLNRQILSNFSTIGKKKVELFKNHLKEINPNIIVTCLDLFYLPGSTDINFAVFDYVIDAIDTVSSKIDIIEKCEALNVKHISALGCGNRLDPSKVVITDISKTKNDPLAKVLRRELKQRNITHSLVCYSEELPLVKETSKDSLPSSIFVPSVAGINIAYKVINDLINDEEK